MCGGNELFFIALYLLSFSSPLLSPSLLTPQPGTLTPGSPAAPKPSTLFLNPWSAGAMEMARYVIPLPSFPLPPSTPEHNNKAENQ